MALFSSYQREYEDPFFSGQMETMRRMEALMDSMMSPFDSMFGAMGLPQLEGARRQPMRGMAGSLMPFGFGRSLFPNMDDMFANFGQMMQTPSCHSYSSSSVMMYSTDETGRPQVYQASSSTRTGPGGMKETRKSVQDSRIGMQKMAIGHHIEDRAHIVERSRNRYTGEDEENQEFINLDEEEAETFNQEWQQRAQSYGGGSHYQTLGYGETPWRDRSPPTRGRVELPAITAGPSSEIEHERETPHRPAEGLAVRGKTAEVKQKRRRDGSGGRKGSHSRRSTQESRHPKQRHETSM